MDFHLSKENIQPLRGGRNASQLGAALQAQTDMDHQRELLQQKGEYEKLIRNYEGDDPLENWYNYISWVVQSYPKQGHEGNMIPLLETCLKQFENDKRYKDDPRLCKLFIKYIDHQQNPLELYHMMHSHGICRGCADMYKAWAYYCEASGDFQGANNIFDLGMKELAQPYDELKHAQDNLVLAAGQHMLYGRNERDLFEKRQVLTSLGTYRHNQVGSVRNPTNTQPVVFGVGGLLQRTNAPLSIYEDRGEELRGAEAAPNSIITAAKRQEVHKENTLKPGPWTTLPVKKKLAVHRTTPSFTVHEDGDENISGATPFVSETKENYSDWVVSLTIPEPHDDRMRPMYPKKYVYAQIGTEFSLEELRAVRFMDRQPPAINIDEQDASMSSLTSDKCNPNVGEHVAQSNQSKLSFINDEQNQNLLPTGATHSFKQVEEKQETVSPNLLAPEQFDFWNSPKEDTSIGALGNASNFNFRPAVPKFSIYEQSNLVLQEPNEPKGGAMKTPFKDLNAEELAETGSRGGMDVAAAAPVDSAKRLPLFDDDSSSPLQEATNFSDVSCNTQMFVFNLNAMQVSTPQNKSEFPGINAAGDSANIVRKQLFSTTKAEDDKVLSTILEETKSYGHSSSSSSGCAGTKSMLFSTNPKQNMATISEEHNSYLAQNLMVNAALRSSSLGDLMDFGPPANPVVVQNSPNVPSRPVAYTRVSPLEFVPSDPFKQSVVNVLLKRVCFPGPHTEGYYPVVNIPKLMIRKESVTIGPDKYVIEKQLGKGTFGIVFRGIDVRSGCTVAVKFQRPPNKWEFYICRELRSRLAQHPLRERFMDVRIGYFSDQASILISEFMPCGSLLDVANMVKQKSGRSMKESLCIHFCLDMLRVVQAMHEVKIIHADIKPDNFLVQLYPHDTIGLQLIDFGCSIDMSLFPEGASFTRRVTTEDFVCCEMKENRPWNYHTDLFCIAATAHVLLFEKYIQMQKRDEHWSISNRLPRYARLDLWNMFFSTLLNQQNGPADSASLQAMLEDSLNHKFDDYHNELRFLTNLLKNR